MKKIMLFLGLLLLLAALTACGSETATDESAPVPTSEEAEIQPEPTTAPVEEPTEGLAPPDEVPLSAVVNISWQWAELVETEPAAQSVVPDPENYTLVLFEDNTFAYKADCIEGSGIYAAEGSSLTLDMGVMAQVICDEGSLSNMYFDALSRVDSFGMRDGKLVLGLASGTGQMMSVNGGTVEKPPKEPQEVPCDAGLDPALVTLDMLGLPYLYQTSCTAATPYDNTQPPGPTGLPDHIQVNFGVEGQTEVLPNDPVIYIIPIEAYKQLWEENGDTAVTTAYDNLVAILQARPDPIPTDGMPVLPFEEVTGTNDLVTQFAYVDTNTGFGVRFVGRFAQSPTPVSNDNPQLFYIYQGLSDDGLYLISFFYPVSTAALPNNDAVTEEARQQVEADPQAYMDAQVAALNALTPENWEPVLWTLDGLITSLEYSEIVEEPAPAITDVLWWWNEWSQPAGPTVIPEPDNYTLMLLTDGSFNFVADCKSGSGTYTLDGSNLSLEVGATTLEVCEEGSLADTYIGLLPQVITYASDAGTLKLNLADEASYMGFYVGTPTDDDPDSPDPTAEPGTPTAVAIEPINMRSGPGTEYESYGVASIGDTFTITGISEDGTWWVVALSTDIAPDGVGWLKADYVEATNAEGVPVVETPPLP